VTHRITDTVLRLQTLLHTFVHLLAVQAKESYHARCVEYEKMRRENASSKDLDKVEAKYKKASEL